MRYRQQSKTIEIKNSMPKETIKVSGMHCPACETLLKQKVGRIDGVVSVRASNARGEIVVSGNYKIAAVVAAIKGAGYFINDSNERWFSRDGSRYLWVIISGIGFSTLLILGSVMGFAQILPSTLTNGYNLSAALILGLVAGLSTCMALVGGLVLGISAKYRELHPEVGTWQTFVPNIYFNLGRILGFFILGGLLGSIGQSFRISSLGNGVATLLVSITMLIIGIQLTGTIPKLSRFSLPLPRWASFSQRTIREKNRYSHLGAFIGGVATFFLPCGFTQATQLIAIGTGSFWGGGLLMAAFALGTVPGLVIVGGASSIITKGFREKFYIIVGSIVVVFAVLNGIAGARLVGIPLPQVVEQLTHGDVQIQDGEQIVRMKVTRDGYEPSSFEIDPNIPVRWIIDVQDISTCAAFILAPEIDVQKLLLRGKNVITFIPPKGDELRFTCSMGMYSGVFKYKERKE